MAMMMAMSMVMSWYDTTDDWSKREALLLCCFCVGPVVLFVLLLPLAFPRK
jgi:hypothetical protein